ncbi:MAG TPA: hypothetical protein VER55_13635 [Ardenticatenaceae bacterium]|nr:hypothetical protein [Ardenticatenaceae bacterium]
MDASDPGARAIDESSDGGSSSPLPEPGSTHPRRRVWIAWALGGLALALVVLRVAPFVLWIYHVELAGRSLDTGLAWPNPRQVDSLPQLRDNQALDAALGHLAAAIRWRPDHAHAHRLTGHVYAARTDWEQAAAALEHARGQEPHNPLISWETGLIYERMWAVVRQESAEPVPVEVAAWQLEAPRNAVETPFCRPGAPQTCYVAETSFKLPYAGLTDEPPYQAPVLFLHPPARVRRVFVIPPERPALRFLLGLDPAASPGTTDGVTFRIWVEPPAGTAEPIFERTVDREAALEGWVPGWVDLSAWAGQRITLVLATDGSPDGATSGDWLGWGDAMLTTVEAARFAAQAPLPKMQRAWRSAGLDAQRFTVRSEQARAAERVEEAERWRERALAMEGTFAGQ